MALEALPLLPVAQSSRPTAMENQWVMIDSMGTVRNTLYTVSVFLNKAAKATQVIGHLIPGFQLAAGGLITYNALKYNLPSVIKEYKEIKPADEEGKLVTGLSVANQVCYGAFGPAFLVGGGTAIAAIATKGAVSSALTQAAEIAAGGVLGGICVARGMVMMARSAINLMKLVPFHNDFRQAVQTGGTEAFFRKQFMGQEYDLDVLKRRMGEDAAIKVQAYIDGDKMLPIEQLIPIVDKGIFKQKCKQWLSLSIAFLMIIGGIASILLTSGLSLLAISAIMGITFALMEAEWLAFDKSDWFNAIVDMAYRPGPEILDLLPNKSLISA